MVALLLGNWWNVIWTESTRPMSTFSKRKDLSRPSFSSSYSVNSSVLQVNPDALTIATERDQDRSSGTVFGPLHGIPFLVKDNIATKDRMDTTAGSTALLGSVVPRDAFVVDKLRSAGAVLLGKATLSEWSSARSTNYSEGYSARGGQIRSPYNLTRQPGGSSGGSAVAVSANVVPFSLGTDTSGSGM